MVFVIGYKYGLYKYNFPPIQSTWKIGNSFIDNKPIKMKTI